MVFPSFRPVLRRAGQFAVYVAFRVIESGVRLLPLEVVFRLGQLGGLVVWIVSAQYRRLAWKNVAIAFGGERSEAARAALVREHFGRLGANLLCSLKLPAMEAAAIDRVVEIVGSEHIAAGLARGRGVVYAVAHLGNWEVLAQMPAFGPGTTAGALFQPLGNPFLNRHIERTRARLKLRLFDRSAGFHAPSQHLRENRVLGVLVDQHAGDGGVWTPLFGRLASTTNLAALLALRTGATFLPVGMVTAGVARWKAIVGAPLGAARGDAAALTAEMNRLIEGMVRQSPPDWFWVHDRWKTPRPHFLLAKYKRGVELPPGMEPSDLQPFQMLVRTPNWLGDACMALPAVRALKRGRPDARVTVLTPANLADFWRTVPDVDGVIAKPPGAGIVAVRAAIRATGIRYDAAVLLVDSPRSAIEVSGCGIPRVVGFRGKWRKWLINQTVPPMPPGPIRHQVHDFLRIAENCGARIDDAVDSRSTPLAQTEGRGETAPLTRTLCRGRIWSRQAMADRKVRRGRAGCSGTCRRRVGTSGLAGRKAAGCGTRQTHARPVPQSCRPDDAAAADE